VLYYQWLGGRGEVLAQATAFSNVLFCGAASVWVMNALASVVRGTGNMRVPSAVILATSVLQILVGGALGLGIGPLPRFGMPGVAIGSITAYSLGAAWLVGYLVRGRGRLTLRLRGVQMQWHLFSDILRVGALACLSPLQSVLAILDLDRPPLAAVRPGRRRHGGLRPGEHGGDPLDALGERLKDRPTHSAGKVAPSA